MKKTLQRGVYYPMSWATYYVVWKIKQSTFISELKSEIGTRSFNYLIKAHEKFGKGGVLTIEVLRSYSQEELMSFYGIGEKTVGRIQSFI